MGIVKRDIHKNESQFKNIPFSDPKAINALIKFRSKIDLYYTYHSEHVENLVNVCILKAEESINENNDANYKELMINNEEETKLSASDINEVNQELLNLYISLDKLISDVSLSEQQEIILNLFMVGFNASEISLYMSKTTQQINKVLKNISKKIATEGKKQWKYNMADQDYIRVSWDYKICSNCNKNLPLTDDFFNKEPKGRDGYKAKCKKCSKFE